MRKYSKNFSVFLFGFLLLTFSIDAFAGTTGKISGIVRDKTTGEAIPGCSISVEGTSLGAICDVNGKYFIINIRPGTYNLVAS
ncbi:MAG: hypothetical protein COZ25_04140, partial [Ignavibacteria bacterium CG_4_10_14_3_um_filter_37_18]